MSSETMTLVFRGPRKIWNPLGKKIAEIVIPLKEYHDMARYALEDNMSLSAWCGKAIENFLDTETGRMKIDGG